MFGLVTTKTYKNALAAQKRAFAAALALASGTTIDDLRMNTFDRLEMVEGVERGLEEQIAETMKRLAELTAKRDHANSVAEDLRSMLDVLPEGIQVTLDPLVIQLGEPTLEVDTNE